MKQALRVSKEAVIPGQDAAIDEQTIGFQGAHEDKKRISEKREVIAKLFIEIFTVSNVCQ